MSEKWFSNRGQVIALVIAVIGVLITILVQWPALKEHKELVDWIFPVLFLASSMFTAYQIGKLRGIVSGANKPKDDAPYRTTVQFWSPTIRMGDFWQTTFGAVTSLKITVSKILPEEPPVAEVRFDDRVLFSFRPRVSLDSHGNTFQLIANRRESEKNAVFSLDFDEESITLIAVRVDHINPHTGEVLFAITRVTAYKRSMLL